jgi:hypothetical protein
MHDEQLEIAKRLQYKLLKRFEKLIDQDEMSATDAATLVRLLSQNGWVLDPAALPQGLRDKLKDTVPAFDQDIDPDEVWAKA